MKNIVIISGGANGLGLELVKQFLNNNYFVCNLDKDEKSIIKLRKTFNENYIDFIGNIADEKFVIDCVKKINKLGNIVCLINNAGTPSFKFPTDYVGSDIDLCFEGIKGMILLSSNVLKSMEKTGGKIVT